MQPDIRKQILDQYCTLQQAMIDKNMEILNTIILDGTRFKHMSGKVQTKQEYLSEIKNGILNYYKYSIQDYNIDIINEQEVHFHSHTTLNAKVYGFKGTWTLSTDMKFIWKDGMWKMTQ